VRQIVPAAPARLLEGLDSLLQPPGTGLAPQVVGRLQLALCRPGRAVEGPARLRLRARTQQILAVGAERPPAERVLRDQRLCAGDRRMRLGAFNLQCSRSTALPLTMPIPEKRRTQLGRVDTTDTRSARHCDDGDHRRTIRAHRAFGRLLTPGQGNRNSSTSRLRRQRATAVQRGRCSYGAWREQPLARFDAALTRAAAASRPPAGPVKHRHDLLCRKRRGRAL